MCLIGHRQVVVAMGRPKKRCEEYSRIDGRMVPASEVRDED